MIEVVVRMVIVLVGVGEEERHVSDSLNHQRESGGMSDSKHSMVSCAVADNDGSSYNGSFYNL